MRQFWLLVPSIALICLVLFLFDSALFNRWGISALGHLSNAQMIFEGDNGEIFAPVLGVASVVYGAFIAADRKLRNLLTIEVIFVLISVIGITSFVFLLETSESIQRFCSIRTNL